MPTDVRPMKLVSPVVLLTWILWALFPIVKILSYIEYIPTIPEAAYNPCVVCMLPVTATDPVSGMSSEAWPVRFPDIPPFAVIRPVNVDAGVTANAVDVSVIKSTPLISRCTVFEALM